jgi:prepilin signal peptidase PulO-like enzyme (type II secretory pathway)
MDTLYLFYSFVFGLLIGSFLNVVIIRLPTSRSLTFERSSCANCNSQLKWYHNIPVLSFLVLKGKCGFCGQRISWRYPLIEVFTGLVSYWLFPNHVDVQNLGFYFFQFYVACIFICHFFIDLEHQLLLDKLNIYLLLAIVPFTVLTYHWSYWVLGGVFGFGVPLFVTWLFYKLRGLVGLGGGDIKLFGILGLLLGPMGIFFTIFLSCFVGAILGLGLIAFKKMNKDHPMPFGPSILLVASFQIFFPQLALQLQTWFF